MSGYYRRRPKSNLAEGFILLFIFAALAITQIKGLASSITTIVGTLLAIGLTGWLIVWVHQSDLYEHQKFAILLILGALATGSVGLFYFPDQYWPEVTGRVIGHTDKPQTIQVNVGSSFEPNLLDITGQEVAGLDRGDSLSLWVNPQSPYNYSLLPQKIKQAPRLFLLYIAAGVIGCALLLVLPYAFLWRCIKFFSLPTIVLKLPRFNFPAIHRTKKEEPFPLRPSINFNSRYQKRPAETSAELTAAQRLQAIDWFQFEKVSKQILESEGWTVKHLGGAHPDAGSDLIAEKNGHRAIIQCKHWHRKQVDLKVIRELLGTQNSKEFHADGAMLFTLTPCTVPAQRFAAQNGILIYSSKQLEEKIDQIGLHQFPELMHPEIKYCPKCGKAMTWTIERDSVEWRCSNFPECDGALPGWKPFIGYSQAISPPLRSARSRYRPR